MTTTGDKFRLRFRKAGDLRLLSHLDLARCLERMLRRANVPFKSSAGFHPSPRMIFAQSMPLGVDGLDEVLELETTAALDAEDVRNRLNAQAPRGLEFTTARVVPMKASAVPRRMVYSMAIPADRVDAVAARAAELLAMDKVWVDRLKPRPRNLNIRPYLRGIAVSPSRLTSDTPEGPHPVAARPPSPSETVNGVDGGRGLEDTRPGIGSGSISPLPRQLR